MRRRFFSRLLRQGCAVGLPAWLFFFAAPKSAAAPGDYLVDKWDTEDNLPSSTVTSIAQTPDGYLWVGTYNGLARFDGARFETFDPVNQPKLGQARVQALFLDANGTLWINTYRGGLTSYRHGGFHHEWPNQPGFDLHTTLVASSSNQVTFVTQFGEVLRRELAVTNAGWKISSPPPETRPIFQCVDGAGRLWFLTRDRHILQFSAGQFKLLADDGGLAGSRIYTLVADAAGKIWAGAENEIAVWDGTQFTAMTPTNGAADIQPRLIFPTRTGALWVLDGDRLRKMTGRAWVAEASPWRGLLGAAAGRAMGAHEDRDGGWWFNHYGNGLFHITPDGRFLRLTAQDNLPSDRVGAWFQSSDGGVWAGVDHGGLVRLNDRRFQVIGVKEGLPVRTALSVCEDAAGAVWIGTAGGGLCRWTNGVVTRFPVGQSVSADFVFSITPRPGGGAWLSASAGEDLFQFQNGQVRRVSWEVHGIKSMLTDRRGRVWMGMKNGIAFSDGGERRILGTNENGTLPAVRALAETPDGMVWAGADDGTLFRCEPDRLTAFRPADALAEQPIYSMTADADGTIWAGTFRGGLLRFKNGKFSRITAKQGLPVDVISQILEDRRGRLWLGTHQGIYCVAKSVLDACADGRVATLDYVTYGRHDGLPALECSDGYQPASWRGADGKLWFTTVNGVVSINPEAVTAKSPPPPVIIEELRVDGEVVTLHEDGGWKMEDGPRPPIQIPPGRKQLDFRFTALSFDAGDKARFRYRVDGLDTDWVDVDRRTLQLRNLAPREYRLRVIACNSEGAWNLTGASVAFVVRPFFYQTLTFRIIAGVLVVAAVSFAVRRAATRKYRRKLALLQQQHAIERDRARIAKDIHDDVGASLTQITLLTELARRELVDGSKLMVDSPDAQPSTHKTINYQLANPQLVTDHLERISDSARTLTKAMDEIVWAVDPQHDTLDGLMDYISAYAEDFLRVAGIRCRMDFPVSLPTTRVEAELRYNLFLTVKEALNNVVKHARADEVWLRLHIGEKSFTLAIEDNGRGLVADDELRAGELRVESRSERDQLSTPKTLNSPAARRLNSGSGLENMKKRLANVGGRCEIHSDTGLRRAEASSAMPDAGSGPAKAGRGTRVEMTAALRPVASPVVAIGGSETPG